VDAYRGLVVEDIEGKGRYLKLRVYVLMITIRSDSCEGTMSTESDATVM